MDYEAMWNELYDLVISNDDNANMLNLMVKVNSKYRTISIEKAITASEMGKKGGSSKTEIKSSASRENGKLGGRPRKIKEGYVSVYKHRGIDICALKEAEASKGDSLKYLTKTFLGENEFDTIQDAIDAIDKDWE